MTYRRRQFNMPHPFPAYFGGGDFNPATVAYYASVADAFVFAAMAFPVFYRANIFSQNNPSFSGLNVR
jgi:hypothetical protein